MKGLSLLGSAILVLAGSSVFADGSSPVKILLVGDSTTIGNTPREIDPDLPHFEHMIEILARAEGLPELEVINAGKGGETAKRLFGSAWYDDAIKTVEAVDYIILRMGINDWHRCKDFEKEFPAQMKALLSQLRTDHPKATIYLSTICRFMPAEECIEVNDQIRSIASDENLEVIDIFSPYNDYLTENGQNALNVRQPYLSSIPESYHELLKPYTHFRKDWGNKPDGDVVMLNDTSLDPVFGHIEGWYHDRHPNSEGYNLIARETVKFLKPILTKTP
ncbi:MAG: SGNH/GDSL hydrolase family protein [Luteolibacter sp.]